MKIIKLETASENALPALKRSDVEKVVPSDIKLPSTSPYLSLPPPTAELVLELRASLGLPDAASCKHVSHAGAAVDISR